MLSIRQVSRVFFHKARVNPGADFPFQSLEERFQL